MTRTHSRLTLGALVSAALLTAFGSPSATAQHFGPRSAADVQALADEPVQSRADALATDTAALAQMWHIPAAEASRQMSLQNTMDTIDYATLDPGYVAIESTPGPDFTITYYTVSQALPSTLSAQFIKAGLSSYVSTRTVPHTMAELTAAQSALREANPGLAVDTWPDLRTGTVHAAVTELPTAALNAPSARAASVPVTWDVVDALAEPAVAGGMPITVGSSLCTAGFVVEHKLTGNRAIATAGHCGTSDGSYAGYYMYYQSRGFGGNADIEWFDNDAVTFNPRFKWNGTDLRDVLSRKLRADMNIGDGVCKYGRTTGYKCGGITTKNFCPSYVPSCLDMFVRVHNNDGLDISEGGDSGGPNFIGNTAWGYTSGQAGSGTMKDAIFMPQEFTGNLNLKVAIF